MEPDDRLHAIYESSYATWLYRIHPIVRVLHYALLCITLPIFLSLKIVRNVIHINCINNLYAHWFSCIALHIGYHNHSPRSGTTLRILRISGRLELRLHANHTTIDHRASHHMHGNDFHLASLS